MRQSRLTRCTIKVTVKSIYFTCGSLKVTKTKFLFFKNVLHRELERKVEKVKVVLYKKNAIFMRNCLKIFLLVFTSFMIQFFGSIVFLSIFCSYIVINCNFERSVTWFPWQHVCLRVVLGLKSALKLVEIALNEVFWPRHIPWETGIHQPRFQVL